mmetsp:Transcript_45518/g.110250  ORF Transcript_45518/g.110250 Transcript_45518/m.110250 type:complete len:648 (-) Transcript_45518:28-1971(-)
MDNATSLEEMAMDQEETAMDASLHPSHAQDQVLAILPIPSALLSVFGSSVIIYMVFKSKQQRKRTPYLRLLFAMSVYDIVLSLNWSVAAFLRPQDTSGRMLSMGNRTTCNLLGFLNELSHATIIYQGMLGVYFLLTARYGYCNSYIARNIEPWMHIVSIGYPLAFAIAEGVLDGYGEVIMGIGCWVVVSTERCSTEFLCPPRILRYLSCAVPLLTVCITLIVSNRVILLYAREQIRPAAPYSTSKSLNLANSTSGLYSEDDDEDWDSDDSSSSSRTPPEPKYVIKQGNKGSSKDEANADILTGSISSTALVNKDQARRLRLVSSQAVLFVVSFLICNVWTGITGLLEDQGETFQDELATLVRHYPIFVIQAIFSPLQGFLNMMVFIRPKYLKFRHLHKGESRLWVVRRAIFGEEVKPTIQAQRNLIKAPKPKEGVVDSDVPEQTNPRGAKCEPISPSVARLPRDMVSDLTASQGDFDHVMQEEDDERWEDKQATTETSRKAPLVSHRRRSSLLLCTSSALDIISENQESVFEAVPVLPGSDELVGDLFNPGTVHRRWKSGSVQQVASSDDDTPKQEELSLSIPARLESSFDASIEEEVPLSPSPNFENNQTPESPKSRTSTSSSIDRPIQIPKRRMSPPPVWDIESI